MEFCGLWRPDSVDQGHKRFILEHFWSLTPNSSLKWNGELSGAYQGINFPDMAITGPNDARRGYIRDSIAPLVICCGSNGEEVRSVILVVSNADGVLARDNHKEWVVHKEQAELTKK
jgi:hypothetical protein